VVFTIYFKPVRLTSVSFFALALTAITPFESPPELAEGVEGVAVDIADAGIASATIDFASGDNKFRVQTRADGTYSIALRPGTYTMTVSHNGFCTFRRAPFVLRKDSRLRFNIQMWVCPTDMEFVRYAELDEVPHTHLKPLVLFATNVRQGGLQRFSGPTTNDDGTGQARKYPAILTFNRLTVQSEEIVYDHSSHALTAQGNVVWEDGSKSGMGDSVEVKLDGFSPRPLSPATVRGQTERMPSVKPKEGFVPNAETAVKVGEAVLIPVYGEEKIVGERPFKATLQVDVWTVEGTLHCVRQPDTECEGGTAVVKISKASGQILYMMHYK